MCYEKVDYKMPKRIAIEKAHKFVKENNLRQVIIVAWDGEITHIVTYGVTKAECKMAAQGGEVIANALGLADTKITEYKSVVTDDR
jgi:hypothetical protein